MKTSKIELSPSRNGGTERKVIAQDVTIPAPNLQTADFTIRGTAPYVQHRFSQKSMQQMMDKQSAGSTAKKGTSRQPKDFDRCFEEATHFALEGWPGIPASALRSMMIDTCRLVGFKMTIAKISVFVVADGFDRVDGTPLVKIEGNREKLPKPERLESGVMDIRMRPIWREWRAKIRIQYDADQFTVSDIANLLTRGGMQVGIGEGRPNSRNSYGCGWGTFQIVND